MRNWLLTSPHRSLLPAISALLLTTISVCVAQPPQSQETPLGNPDRRQIQQFIFELESTGTEERPAQAAETFDAAWELVVRNEDLILTYESGTARELRAGQHQVDAGARSRLERIFRRSTNTFRRTYEDFVRARAESSLQDALASDNPRDLSRTILRYQFTQAGQNALRNLIQLHVSRGETLEAALQFSRLARLQGKTSPEGAFRQAQLWWRAGLDQDATDVLQKVPRDGDSPTVSINGQPVTLPETAPLLKAWLSQTLGEFAGEAAWEQPMGNYRRTQLQAVGPPTLTTGWSVSAFACAECVECLDDSEINRLLQPIEPMMQDLFRLNQMQNHTLFPVAAPVVAGDKVIFRGAAKIRAVDRISGELAWETTLIGRRWNEALEQWRRQGLQDDSFLRQLQESVGPSLFDHWTRAAVAGQLTTDGRRLFAVEDSSDATARSFGRFSATSPMVNFLRVYDVDSGLLKGQAGGLIGASGQGGRANTLAGMYFLGAPLLLGDQAFAIAENPQGIFLLRLQLVPLFDDERQLDIRPVSTQLISIPQYALAAHPVRRFAGLAPSFAQGLLICQTCDGKVVAVSADDQSIRWVYRYADNVSLSELTRYPVVGNAYNEQQSSENDKQSRWVDSLVRIDGERVLLTPRDADRLICIDLNTGAEIWSRPRGSMRQLVSVTEGRLILTGMRHVECRAADSGEQLWRYELPDARVCGTGACDGRVVQVPTTSPAILTLDVDTGRLLLSQPCGPALPGNLIATEDGLLSQNLTRLTRFVAGEVTDSPVQRARADLLQADVGAAERRLAEVLSQPTDATAVDTRKQATDMMVELLLQSLKLDFDAHADRIPELQKLMAGVSVSDEELAGLLSSMIVMTPGDASRLPGQWKRVNQQQEKLRQLDALVAQRSFALNQKSAEETVERMMTLLDQTQGQSRDVQSPVRTTSWRLAQASVARGLQEQNAELRPRVAELLGQRLAERIVVTAEPESVFDWWETSLLCGLTGPLAPLTERTDIRLPQACGDVIREVTLLEDAADGGDLARLWRFWAEGRPESVVGMARRSVLFIGQQERGALSEIGTRVTLPRDFAVTERERIIDARTPFAEAGELMPPDPFVGRPVVTPGPARVGQSAARLMTDSPQRNVPLLGDNGAFSDWNFFQRPNDRTVRAYDDRGQLRWEFEPPGGLNSRHVDQKEFSRYAVAYGHLLALKLNSDVFLLDCSQAGDGQPPATLWDLNVERDVSAISTSQSQTPAFQSTVQYDVEPPGFFPVAEISPLGVPVYAGQTLQLRSLFTGQLLWEVDGLPDDCKLTCTETEVLLISRKTGSVECRSLLDGRVVQTRSLPDWWDDSNENTNASLYELELNPGETVRWRLTIENGVSLLHAVTTESAALEAWDIRQGKVLSRYDLPKDSVVSNVVDRHVAVLSSGNMLQLINVAAGASVCRHRMDSAGECMHLYLRKSQDRWMVMTSFSGPDYYEELPVGGSVKLNGWVCGLSTSDGSLVWKKDVNLEWLKQLSPSQALMPTVAPLLVLMKRPEVKRDDRGMRVGAVVYTTRVLDVNTGEILFADRLGRDLSYHCLQLDPGKRTITIGFGIRDVVFDYSRPSPDKAP